MSDLVRKLDKATEHAQSAATILDEAVDELPTFNQALTEAARSANQTRDWCAEAADSLVREEE
jgi:hypothetical protein